jgi:hypothetical protein
LVVVAHNRTDAALDRRGIEGFPPTTVIFAKAKIHWRRRGVEAVRLWLAGLPMDSRSQGSQPENLSIFGLA